MGGQIWGTFSVKDHCQPNAFVREVLLFDRLVLPVPENDQERTRWLHPNAQDPEETWDPERLDRLRDILGTQDVPAQPAPAGGWLARMGRQWMRSAPAPAPPPLTWDSPWTEHRWQYYRSRVMRAQTITHSDAYYTTRQILATGQDLPGVIEAVAAFPSAGRCRAELKPSDQPPADPTAAQALLMLAAPLLTPRGDEGKDFGPLRDAAALARDAKFRAARQAYYDWMREFVRPLQSAGHQALDEVRLDRGSLKLAEEQLHGLVTAERELLGQQEQRRWWTRAEYAMTVISVGATAGLALTAALPVLGAAAPVIGFGGWLAGKLAAPEPPEQRPLGGASVFVTAQRRLGWDG
jgi:hypothetical protein